MVGRVRHDGWHKFSINTSMHRIPHCFVQKQEIVLLLGKAIWRYVRNVEIRVGLSTLIGAARKFLSATIAQ